MQEIEAKINAILSDVLEIDPEKMGGDICMSNTPAWNSLAHINIFMSVEEEFDINFDEADLPKLNSKSALIAKVQELLGKKR